MASVQRHTWAQTVVSLATRQRHYGVLKERKKTLDFAALQIARGGFFEEAINDADAPLLVDYVNPLCSALPQLCKSPYIREILGTPTSKLTVRDIHSLFSACEDFVANAKVADKAQHSLHVRRIFLYCRTRLSSGETVERCGFTSRFRWVPVRGSVNLLSETYDDFFDDEFLRQPLTAVPQTDQATTDALANHHLVSRLQRVMDSCAHIMNDYDNYIELVREIRKSDPLSGLPPRIAKELKAQGHNDATFFLEGASPETRLKATLYLSKKHQYHKIVPRRRLFLYDIPALVTISGENTARYLLGALLSEFYLPRLALTACFIILLAETGWNPDTLLSLKSENIKFHNGNYTIVGLKSKSDQLEEATISPVPDESSGTEIGQAIESPIAIRAIGLLLTHRKNIDKYAHSTSKSVFVTLNLKYSRGTQQVFILGQWAHNIDLFCSHTGIPRFNYTDIRDQAAHIKFLSLRRDIYSVQAFLNHSSAETTTHYLNSTIIRCLGEANILHFVRLLAASAIFACKRTNMLLAHEVELVKKNNLLLFPVSTLEDTDTECIADSWFSAMGYFKFTITESEIEHTAIQYLFYKESIRILIEENHLRFIHIHLPRILFCVSLHRLISQSPFKRLLVAAMKKFEKAI